jgi:hypothetical protein
MATEGTIGVSQPAASTITMVVRTVTQVVSTTTVHQEVLTIGGAESTLELARVISGTPADEYGLVTRSLIYDGGDVFSVRPGSTDAHGAFSVRMVDSSGTGFASLGIDYTDGSTTSTLAAPGMSYNNGTNATMRLVGLTQPFPVQIRTGVTTYNSTTKLITSTASSAVYSIASSVASQSHKVYAIGVYSTHTRPSSAMFMSSNAKDVWAGMFGSGSSGVTGFNYAVTPPAYLFKTDAGEALNIRIDEQSTAAASTTVARISVSWFTEA